MASVEESECSSMPIRLYEFELQGRLWNYTSADSTITRAGKTWTAVAISDDGVDQSGETDNEGVTITMDSSLDVSNLFSGAAPSDDMAVRIYSAQEETEDTPCIFPGLVQQVDFGELGIAKFMVSPVSATLDRYGLRLTYARQCPHYLYGRGCLVNKTLFETQLTIAEVSGATFSAPELVSFEDGWFAGGYIKWIHPFMGEIRRTIIASDQSVITIYGRMNGFPALGEKVTAYAGCNRTLDMCALKFNNSLNYGGCPAFPGVDPYTGSGVL